MSEIKNELPKGFTVRGAELNDVDEAVELFKIWAQVMIEQSDVSDTGAIRDEWSSPGFDPAEDIRMVFSSEGKMVGYVEVWTTAKPPVHPWIWSRVHPSYSGLGIGTWLLQWGEERACKVLSELPADVRFAPRIGAPRTVAEAKKLFESLGFKQFRSSYEMQIDMESAPPAPQWADGITLKTFTPDMDMKAVYETVRETFRDHFGHIDEPFETGFARFNHFMNGEGCDPALWFLAMDGDEIVGISLCRPQSYSDADSGFVNILGVKRPWRKRGLGLMLLQHSFGEFYRRGKRKVGLGVDAESLTGALRLYEKAGMHVHVAFDLFEKTIRSGREISVESVSE